MSPDQHLVFTIRSRAALLSTGTKADHRLLLTAVPAMGRKGVVAQRALDAAVDLLPERYLGRLPLFARVEDPFPLPAAEIERLVHSVRQRFDTPFDRVLWLLKPVSNGENCVAGLLMSGSTPLAHLRAMPAEPAPSEPAPAEPASSEPVHAEPGPLGSAQARAVSAGSVSDEVPPAESVGVTNREQAVSQPPIAGGGGDRGAAPTPSRPSSPSTGVEWPVVLDRWKCDALDVELTSAFALERHDATDLDLDSLRRLCDDLTASLTIEGAPPEPGWAPMHGDLTRWNLRTYADGRRVLFDWEHTGWGPPGADLVRYAATSPDPTELLSGLDSVTRASCAPAVRHWRNVAERRAAGHLDVAWKAADSRAELERLDQLASLLR